MLTIKGIEKLYKQDAGEWRIARVETLDSAYLFQLRKPNGANMQVNLERNKTEENKYELWHWKPYKGTTRPNRLLLNKDWFETMNSTLSAIKVLIH